MGSRAIKAAKDDGKAIINGNAHKINGRGACINEHVNTSASKHLHQRAVKFTTEAKDILERLYLGNIC